MSACAHAYADVGAASSFADLAVNQGAECEAPSPVGGNGPLHQKPQKPLTATTPSYVVQDICGIREALGRIAWTR